MFSGTKCLGFVNIPVFLEIVFEIASMWLKYGVWVDSNWWGKRPSYSECYHIVPNPTQLLCWSTFMGTPKVSF